MFSVFFYIVPALLIRYLIWREQLKKGEAFGVSVILLFVLFVVSIFLRKSMGDSMLGGSLPWVLIASVWSYFILRAKGENAEPVEAFTLQQKTITPQKKQVEIEPKASTPTKKETETIPAPQAERVEPVKTEKLAMSSSHDDEQFYEQVAAEFNDGTIKQGLWLKAETKAEGDKDKARLLYIEWRVQQLTEEADKAKQAKAWEELVEAEAQANKERDEEEAEAVRKQVEAENKRKQMEVRAERERLQKENEPTASDVGILLFVAAIVAMLLIGSRQCS